MPPYKRIVLELLRDRPTLHESEEAAAAGKLADQIREASQAWLLKSPSKDTRSNLERDICQFLAFAGVAADQPQELAKVRPAQVWTAD